MGHRITRVLAEDYAVMSALADRAGASSDRAESTFLWAEFVQMAGSHFLALEKIIIPAVQQCGAGDRVADLSAAIYAAQEVLSDVLTTGRSAAQDPEGLVRLVGAMHRLHEREGARLATTLTECLDDGALRLLGVECEHFLSLRRLQLPTQRGDLSD